MRGNLAGLQDIERNVSSDCPSFGADADRTLQGNPRSGQTPGGMSNLSFLGSQIPPQGGNGVPPIGQRPSRGAYDQAFGTEGSGSPSTQAPHKKIADMTDSERYGLPGLLSMIPLDSPDYSSLAVGQDLTVLGLDLSRPE
jgi:CCR4-NOT transcription complex subunit 2